MGKKIFKILLVYSTFWLLLSACKSHQAGVNITRPTMIPLRTPTASIQSEQMIKEYPTLPGISTLSEPPVEGDNVSPTTALFSSDMKEFTLILWED